MYLFIYIKSLLSKFKGSYWAISECFKYSVSTRYYQAACSS